MSVGHLLVITIMVTIHCPILPSKTTHPPCCRDTLSQVTCQRLQRVNASTFGHRCNSDVEFRLIQCCATCNRFKGAIDYDRIAESLVQSQCFDRYGDVFCKRYVDATDVWEMKQRPCDGNNPYIAFRSCRKSCGFCDFSQVKYTLHNALEACRMVDRLQTR
ncbi:unnamed protein product [Bursaphelenchus xylophilus]|uniref:(pine wood nematode) hypothetical protein n=1 Tax=Bursaphelenchus xylophilus TaxID=6326 RepID=A0A1I7RKR4_BURXY|nr:unnamed protein product [Bursaphelenchus xylophilus]CAG9131134.1 unnamed protein product [Bursaphelenchus xylophilus]